MKNQSALSNEFYSEFTANQRGKLEWLAYLGEPTLYDGGLFVNRSPEDHALSESKWIELEAHIRNYERKRLKNR